MDSRALLNKYHQIRLDYRAKAAEIFKRFGMMLDTSTPIAERAPTIIANEVALYCGSEAPEATRLLSDMATPEELSTIRKAADAWKCTCEDASLKIDLPDIQAHFSNEETKCVIRGLDITDMIEAWRVMSHDIHGVFLNLSLKFPPPKVFEVSCISDGIDLSEVMAGWLSFSISEEQTVDLTFLPKREIIKVDN